MRSEQMPQSSAFAACCVVQFTELSKNGGLGTATSVKARDRPVDRSNEVRCVAPSGEAGGRPRAFRRAGRCRLEAPKTGFGRDHEILRKEVIQPQVPLRLPCYDLVPITGFIFGACLAAPATSDAPRFGGLTGGVYKAQEHIHRGNADPRLLAIPASRRRVAASDLNWDRV